MYGPTETTIWSTTGRLGAGNGSVFIGRPIDNTQLYIVNPSLQPQPIGVPGELLIGGDGLAAGYLNRPELNVEKFIPNPFNATPGARLYRTGDFARWRADGSLECLGRLDLQVKIRGFRIELGEIESLLEKHPSISQAAVVVREDKLGRKILVAYLVSGVSPGPETSELRAYVAAHLPAYMVPSTFISLDRFPLTPNGKIDRRALPATAPSFETAARASVAPRTEKERILAEIWREVLGVPQVGMTDDFFELGGDSLMSFRITNRANQAGLPLTPRMFFQHRTLAELSVALEIPAVATPAARSLVTRVSRENFRRPAPGAQPNGE